MLRRSMPWGGVREHGLYFVAYVESLDRTGGYYFCPPMRDRRVDLRDLGL